MATVDSSSKTTKNPITVGGWYEHTDGTWGRYEWSSQQHVVCCEIAARPPTREESIAAHEASESDYLAWREREDAERHAKQ